MSFITVPQIPLILLVAGAALVGLWWSNFFYDHGIAHWQSRKIGHFFGGTAAIIAVFVLDSWLLPTILAGLFALILGLANKLRPHTFRGVGGSGRPSGAMSEMWFPLALTICWGVGWGIFNKSIESTVCSLMMAWGDCLTGWVRALKYDTPTKGIEGSLAMFGVCIVLAWAFIHPFLLGLAMSIGATVTEYFCGDVSKVKWLRWLDDNFAIPIVALAILLGGLSITGGV